MYHFASTPTSIHYEDGAAPFGETLLMRAAPNVRPQMQELASLAAGQVLQRAWLTSDWMETVYGRPIEEGDATWEAAKTATLQSAAQLAMAAERAFRPDAPAAFWLATGEPRPDKEGLSYVTGAAYTRQDASGNVAERFIKRHFFPDKQYAKLSDLNVMPEYQRSGLGAALLEASLRTVADPTQKPTTYVPAINQPLIESLGDVGFKVTGERPRTDLVMGHTITEARLEAPSTGYALVRLREKYPWIGNAVIDHKYS